VEDKGCWVGSMGEVQERDLSISRSHQHCFGNSQQKDMAKTIFCLWIHQTHCAQLEHFSWRYILNLFFHTCYIFSAMHFLLRDILFHWL